LVMSHSESGSSILNCFVSVMVNMHASNVYVVDCAFDALSGKIYKISIYCFLTKNTALDVRVKNGCLQVMCLSEVTYFFSDLALIK